MSSANRVISNTGFLYAKMLITMFVALFSTRLVLQALGAEDFGIFSLVSGIVLLLAFVNAAISTSTQRFISICLGSGDSEKVADVFRTSLQLHLGLAIFLAFLLELVGLFIFDGFLNIPSERMAASKIIYHFMVVSTFFTIISVPYVAALVAHEDFWFEALIGIAGSILKLIVAVVLFYSNGDRLVLYGALMAGIIVINCLLNVVFAIVKYEECKRIQLNVFDRRLMGEMSSFACWNLFGALCSVGRAQGTAVILNVFFGTIVNAAYGVARQVSSQTSTFSVNMLKALSPLIMKSEGGGDRQKMLYLSMVASRFGYFLLAFFAVPLIAEAPFVLDVWLKTVPDYTVIFCRLILIGGLVGQITIGLQTAAQSVGKIKLYQSVVGSLLLLNVPVSWVVLKMGYNAYVVFLIAIFFELLAAVLRIFFLRKLAGLPVGQYVKEVVVRGCLCTIPVVVTVLLVQLFLPPGWLRLFSVVAVSSVTFCVTIYCIGMNGREKKQVISIMHTVPQKIKARMSA
ncbi:MAG: MATE family efflux transporter [Desulfocapsa sp.]|nr:MATE family efflux transporter [Desulfocapsa sp.]MBN4064000.1 MATE family efflux transporter [bacterium AH-315-I07]